MGEGGGADPLSGRPIKGLRLQHCVTGVSLDKQRPPKQAIACGPLLGWGRGWVGRMWQTPHAPEPAGPCWGWPAC